LLRIRERKKNFSIKGKKVQTDGTNDRAIGNDIVAIKNLNQPWAVISLASEEVRGAIQWRRKPWVKTRGREKWREDGGKVQKCEGLKPEGGGLISEMSCGEISFLQSVPRCLLHSPATLPFQTRVVLVFLASTSSMYLCRCTLTSLPHISETLDNAVARGIRFIRLRCFLRLNSRRDLEIVTFAKSI